MCNEKSFFYLLASNRFDWIQLRKYGQVEATEYNGRLWKRTQMVFKRGMYRLVGLDGVPHPVLDAPYDSIDAALSAAKTWCSGQGLNCSLSQRAIGVEVQTSNGSWRTIRYPRNCLQSF